MKVYRVVPDSFATNERLYESNPSWIEDIYYYLGYTSFLGNRRIHTNSSIKEDVSSIDGKYFFLFPEQAYFRGSSIIKGIHQLKADTYLIVEYDIPDEIVFKHLGYSIYCGLDSYEGTVISYIEKEYFGVEAKKISEIDITTEDRKKIFAAYFESLKRIKEYGYNSAYADFSFYTRYYWKTMNEILMSKDMLKVDLEHSSLYNGLFRKQGEIIKSPYITGMVFPVCKDYLSRRIGSRYELSKYFQDQGMPFDYSKQKGEFMDNVVRNLQRENEEGIEKAKCLLRTLNH